ncbi:uncharacterized protein LOC132263232 [Phlebotomus argentipes]|uniref:uncharacterized protein LOC132263232 n=1 Tax=Phlebotomus argentipes TaxID=94469 RepID=UPI00289381E2|nr:uncharacterized protein LOC132263232 [Phlebotomus argentipes]
MELTQIQSEFANILNEFSDLVKPLRNIQSFRGCEFFMNTLIKKIQSFLVAKEVFTTDFAVLPHAREALREIIILLVANMEDTLSGISEDVPIKSLTGRLPVISQNLFYMLIWQLNLQDAFLELISFSPICLVSCLMVIFPDAMTHLDQERNLAFAEKFTVAVYSNIFDSEHADGDSEIALSYCMKFLKDYFKCDKEAFPNMKTSQFHLHFGEMIRHMLKILLQCLKIFTTAKDKKTDCPEIFMKMFQKKDSTVSEETSPLENPTVLAFNEKLFNMLKSLSDGVTVLVFCDWMEVDVKPGVTLQREIGDLAAELLEIPNEENNLTHEVFAQIKFLKPESKNEEQVASSATIREILGQLETLVIPREKSVWISELISRGGLVLENEECLEAIERNAYVMNVTDYIEVARYVQNFNPDTEETLRDILLLGTKNLPIEEAVHLITTELIYLPTSTMQTSGFQQETQSFLIAKRWTESGYLRLLAQNPQLLIEKMSLWVIDHEKDMKIALKFLQMTEKVTGMFLESTIKNLITFPTHSGSSRLLANWIGRLFNCGLLRKSKIVKNLYKNLVEFVKKRDEKRILSAMTIFSVLAQKSTYGEDSAKVLLIAGIVLNGSRWSLETYTEELKEIVRLSIVTIVETMKDFLKYASLAEKSALNEKTSAFSPSVGFFFQKLSLSRSTSPQNFAEFIFQKDSLENVPQEDLENMLSQIIIHITPKEAVWLASNEFLRPSIEGVLRKIAIHVSELPSGLRVAPARCFRNCMINYQHALEKNIIPELTEARDKVIFLNRFLELLEVIPHEIYNEFTQNISAVIWPVFNDAFEDECIPDCHSVLIEQITALRDCNLKKNLLRDFQVSGLL